MKPTSLPLVTVAAFALACSLTARSAEDSLAITKAKQAIFDRLRDPESARFKIASEHDGVVCGEFNSKNGMGGYVGFETFAFKEGMDPPLVFADPAVEQYVARCSQYFGPGCGDGPPRTLTAWFSPCFYTAEQRQATIASSPPSTDQKRTIPAAAKCTEDVRRSLISQQVAQSAIDAACGPAPQVEDLPHHERILAQAREEAALTATLSGLKYRIRIQGHGKVAKRRHRVTIHYDGMLVDGTVFDSTLQRGPAMFPISGVIPGLQEVLTMWPEGTTGIVVIPPHLGYGAAGTGGPIGPNATLIFEVNIVKVHGLL